MMKSINYVLLILTGIAFCSIPTSLAETMGESWQGIHNITVPTHDVLAQHSEKRIEKINDHIRELKNKVAAGEAKEERTQLINKIEDKRDQAEQKVKQLKEQGDENFRYSATDLPRVLDEAEKAAIEAATKILSEKEAYEWKVESSIQRLESGIDAAKRNLEGVQGPDKTSIEGQTKRLEAKRDHLKNKLNELKSKNENDWNSLKNEIDPKLESVQKIFEVK